MKDDSNKVMQNYHTISLRMLGNLYITNAGKEFMQGEDPRGQMFDFCNFSFDSVNPRIVFTAAVVLFN